MSAPRALPATIAAPVQRELVIKKSRFIAQAVPATSDAEISEALTRILREHWNANHHCIAAITGTAGDHARSSDDGEPAGTAGAPILETLRHRHLTDVLVVVTRFFGGVKLGAGGLIRAYSTAASQVLDAATLRERHTLMRATIRATHTDAGRFENFLREWVRHTGASFDEVAYAADAEFQLWIHPEDSARLRLDLAEFSSGSSTPVFGEERVIEISASHHFDRVGDGDAP